MDVVRIDAVSCHCLKCGKRLQDRHRVLPVYIVGELKDGLQLYDLGLFVNGVRTMWRHIDCQDPQLASYNMLPSLEYCIKCRAPLSPLDLATPVYQILDPKAQNPNDREDIGVILGERIHFAHIDCTDRTFKASALVMS